MAISPGKKEPYEPCYVRYGKESGVCSEYGRKPVKGAQALCYMLQIRKFPEGRGPHTLFTSLQWIYFPSLSDLGT